MTTHTTPHIPMNKARKKTEWHGDSRTKFYCIYKDMLRKCDASKPLNRRNINFAGKGIKVCEEWANSYISFKSWALSNGYKEGLELGRIDVFKDFCPENCRFVDHKQNCLSKRKSVLKKLRQETRSAMGVV